MGPESSRQEVEHGEPHAGLVESLEDLTYSLEAGVHRQLDDGESVVTERLDVSLLELADPIPHLDAIRAFLHMVIDVVLEPELVRTLSHGGR